MVLFVTREENTADENDESRYDNEIVHNNDDQLELLSDLRNVNRRLKFTPQYYKRVRSSDVYFLDISEGDKVSQNQ